MNPRTRSLIAALGGILLLLAPQCPSVLYASGDPPQPFGSQTLYDDATGDSLLTMLIGATVLVLALLRHERALRWTAAAAVAVVVLYCVTSWAPAQLASGVLRGFRAGAARSGEALAADITLFPAWGWALLLAAGVLLATAAIPRDARASESADSADVPA